MTRTTSRPQWATRYAEQQHDWRDAGRRSRAFGEATVIPTPRRLHPERYHTDPTAVGVAPSTAVAIPIVEARDAPRQQAKAENEWNWKLAVVSAIPILAGVALLILGLAPGAVALRW